MRITQMGKPLVAFYGNAVQLAKEQAQPKVRPAVHLPVQSPVRFGLLESVPTWAIGLAGVAAASAYWYSGGVSMVKATHHFSQLWNNAKTDPQKASLIRNTLQGSESFFQQYVAYVAVGHIAQLNDPTGLARLDILLENSDRITPSPGMKTGRKLFDMKWNLYYLAQQKDSIVESFKKLSPDPGFYQQEPGDLPLEVVVSQYLTSLAMLDSINDKNHRYEKKYDRYSSSRPTDPYKSSYDPLFEQFSQSRATLKRYADRLRKIEQQRGEGSIVPRMLLQGIDPDTAAKAETLIRKARKENG